jgi:predicted nucleotidyltransferase
MRAKARRHLAFHEAALHEHENSMVETQTIDDAAQRLLEAAPPGSGVIVFGSYARGTAGPSSDLDFLVIEPAVANRYEEMVRLRDVLRDVPASVDVLVTSRSTFEEWRDTPNNVLFEAWKEGRKFGEVE